MTKATIAALAGAIVMVPVSARADRYDECVQASVPASKDRLTLRGIKRGCADRASVDIPPGRGELPVRPDTEPRQPGAKLVVPVASFTVTNDTGYRITEIVIHVAGSNEDRRKTFIERGETERLTIILDPEDDDYRWWQSHTVTVTATKGILPDFVWSPRYR